jgi:hypothetical protein
MKGDALELSAWLASIALMAIEVCFFSSDLSS